MRASRKIRTARARHYRFLQIRHGTCSSRKGPPSPLFPHTRVPLEAFGTPEPETVRAPSSMMDGIGCSGTQGSSSLALSLSPEGQPRQVKRSTRDESRTLLYKLVPLLALEARVVRCSKLCTNTRTNGIGVYADAHDVLRRGIIRRTLAAPYGSREKLFSLNLLSCVIAILAQLRTVFGGTQYLIEKRLRHFLLLIYIFSDASPLVR